MDLFDRPDCVPTRGGACVRGRRARYMVAFAPRSQTRRQRQPQATQPLEARSDMVLRGRYAGHSAVAAVSTVLVLR